MKKTNIIRITSYLLFLVIFFQYFGMQKVSQIYAAEPELIELIPGTDDPYLDEFIDLNGIAIFTAYDEVHGQELWRSDGTYAGTTLVKDIYPGVGESYPQDFIKVGDEIFFNATTDGFNEDLWKTDGTELGTVLVKDFEGSDGMEQAVNVNGTIFFYGEDVSHGRELWKSDGTEGGTVMVKDITSGGGDTMFVYTGKAVGNYFVFTISSNLWSSDGTEAGTQQITSGLSVAGIDDSPVYNGYVYFYGSNATYGAEPWRSDGTVGGTTILKDVVPGTSGCNPGPFVTFNNHLYFWTWDDEFYKSDGTAEGTEKVHDQSYYPDWFEPMVEMNNDLYFVAADWNWDYGEELWKIDAETGVASMVKDIYPGDDDGGVENLEVIGDKIYFSATDNSEGGYNTEPWVSDGTEEGTHMLANICPQYDEGSYPDYFTKVGDKLFFGAWTYEHGEELYVLNTVTTLSDDSSLSDVTISGFSISPTFNPDTTTYTLTVFPSTTSISLTGTTTSSEATIAVNNQPYISGEIMEINLESGVNTINLRVTAEDGVSETIYILTVTKPVEEEEEQEEEDIVIPPSIKITKIGYLSSIPDSSYLQYFYPSRNVNIQGVATANSTIRFTIDSRVYTTTADGSGNFSITLYLSEGINTIEYVSKDILNNESTKRVLRMIISETDEVIDEDEDQVIQDINNEIPEEDIPAVTQTPEETDNTFGERVADFIKGLSVTRKQAKDIATGSLISLPVLTALSFAFGNTYIGAFLIRVFSYILALFRIGKKKRNCGLIYNSITKEPLSMAIVRIFSKEGRLVATEVTNPFGIFESSLPSDTYKLSININGYIFPSSLISGTQDLPYKNIYKGGDFNITNNPISYSIPVDPINKSVIQEIKTVLRNRVVNVSIVLINIVILIGLTFSILSYVKVPNTFNLALLILYILTLLITVVMNSQGKYRFGIVRDIYEDRLEGLELSLMETEFGTNFAKRITDEKGKYRFIVPGGEYKLVSTDINYDILLERESIFKGEKDKVMVISNDLKARKR